MTVAADGAQRSAAEDDRAGQSACVVWRPDRDLHRGEVVRVDGARHGEGSAAAIWDEERTSRRHLPMARGADVPALVPLRIPEVLEVMHGQGDIPAAGGILAGRCLSGGGADAASPWPPRWQQAGWRPWRPRCREAERDDDGGSDDGSCGGNNSGAAASVASPRRQASDGRPGLVLGRRQELGNRLDLGLGFSRRLALGNRVEPGGGLILGVGWASRPRRPLLGHRGGHRGDRPVFEVSGGLDVRAAGA